MRTWLGIIPAIALAACSSRGDLLSSLPETQTKVSEIKAAPEVEAKRNYRAFLDEAAVTHPGYSTALERLAVLEMEQAEQQVLEENQRRLEEAVRLREEDGGERGYWQAIGLFEEFLRVAGDDPRVEWVNYQLAKAYFSVGQAKRGVSVFLSMLEKFPRSEYRPEIYLRLGEYYFQLGRQKQAIEYYSLLLALPGLSAQEIQRGRFKRAWALYKVDEYARAMTDFFAVAQHNVTGDVNAILLGRSMEGETDEAMFRELIRGVSLCVDAWGARAALDHLGRLPGDDGLKFLVVQRLAYFFHDKERFKDAIDLLLRYAMIKPSALESRLLYVEAVGFVEKAGYHRLTLKIKQRFLRSYTWLETSGLDDRQELVVRVNQEYLRLLDEMAVFNHAMWRKHRRQKHQQEAIYWYAQRIAFGPETREKLTARYRLAELYLEVGDCSKAESHFAAVAYSPLEVSQRDDAAHSAIRCRLKSAQSPNGIEWTAQDAAVEKYLEGFKHDERAATVAIAWMELLERQTQTALLEKHARRFTEFFPTANPESRRKALRLYANAAYKRKDYIAAAKAYGELTQGQTESTAERNLQAHALFRAARQQLESGDWLRALALLQEVRASNADAALSEKAQFEIARCHLELEAYDKADAALVAYLTEFPQGPMRLNALEKRLWLAQHRNDVEAQASLWLALAREQGESQRLPSLLQAAHLFAQAERSQHAVKVAARVLKMKAVAHTDRIEMMAILVAATTGQTRHRWLQKMVREYSGREARLDERGRYLFARGVFQLAELEQRNFTTFPLAMPLQRSLKKKKRYFEQAAGLMRQVAGYGFEDLTTQATFALAEMYAQFARAIIDSEQPGNLTELEREEYLLLLEETAFPFEEKAIELHTLNVSRIAKGTYDPSVARSMEALATLMPARYGKQEQHAEVFTSLY